MIRLLFSFIRFFIMASVIFLLMKTLAVSGDRFTDNGNGTVTDHKTGLMWAKSDNRGNINWHEAVKWVKYTFPDTIASPYDDWCLPTPEELESLYAGEAGYEADCGQQVRIVPLIELSCGWVWTSEKKSITARLYNFQRGYHYTDRMVKTRGYRVLPVRSLK